LAAALPEQPGRFQSGIDRSSFVGISLHTFRAAYANFIHGRFVFGSVPPILQRMTCDIPDNANASFRTACMAFGAHDFFDRSSEFELVRDTIEHIAREHFARTTQERGALHV